MMHWFRLALLHLPGPSIVPKDTYGRMVVEGVVKETDVVFARRMGDVPTQGVG